ncbi:hypothetical protein A2U01_0013442, partial [Trifolium medium]|nr:hypothetical protein [Trifolium medium]
MFVAAFQNGLRAGHFNESLAWKPAVSMEEIMKRAKCYIKGKESNAEKQSRDAKEKGREPKEARTPEHHKGRWRDKNYPPYMSPKSLREERRGRTYETYTPLNTRRVHVLQHILQTKLAYLPQRKDDKIMMGPNKDAWCSYHRARGHDVEDCYRLRAIIEELIKGGHLKRYLERRPHRDESSSRQRSPRPPRKQTNDKDKGKETTNHVINTIAGGFSGGGESNFARKKYVRQVNQIAEMIGKVSFPKTPEPTFSEHDAEGIVPHDNDPLIIQVHIFNWNIKRVLVDSGSSADIMYWDVFIGMRLANEQLQPYNDTLVGFSGEQVEVMGHIMLLTSRPALGALGAVMSTL